MQHEPHARQHGPWRILRTEQVYRDPWLHVARDRVIRPDGRPGTHCVASMKPGVSVLPIGRDERLYLTDEFHYGIGRHSLEAVSGGREPHEDPTQTARRELREELGIEARRWTQLATVDPFTTIVVSPTVLFLAQELAFTKPEPEGTERIRCVELPLDEAVRRVMDGRITHAPTALLILKARLLKSDLT